MLEAFNHLEGFRLNSLTSLSSQIYKSVSIKVNFTLHFNNDPALRPPPTEIGPATMMPYVYGPAQTHFDEGRHAARRRPRRHLPLGLSRAQLLGIHVNGAATRRPAGIQTALYAGDPQVIHNRCTRYAEISPRVGIYLTTRSAFSCAVARDRVRLDVSLRPVAEQHRK